MSLFSFFEIAPPADQPEPRASDLAELESKMNAACRAAGVDPERIEARASDSPALSADIMDLIRRGMKIQAIKAYRDATGADLRTSKDIIEAVEAGDPYQFLPRYAVHAKLDAVLTKLTDKR